ncbi:helicase C-terminal domain-containing protein [Streptomyces formicae]|uniref:Helicase C-terminal domain-containing protein n=1 Tax=Streptomyces formicae TaxID=1616117 RepID=A0ABY3WUU8_9ACTN|nr:helicase C-terminal domain-containing protein [Streptomyces formicae]
MSNSRASRLSAWLRTLDGEQLRRVLDARPDSVRAPEPCTLGELADRLQRPGSVARALQRLPLPCLQTAEALAALGTPVSRTELGELLGTDTRALDPVLRALADQALVWPGTAGELHMAAALRTAWVSPLGLGPGLAELLSSKTSEELRTMVTTLGLTPGTRKQQRLDAVLDHHGNPGRLLRLLDSAPARARELLEQHCGPESPLILYGSAAPGSTERWLLDRALLVGRPWSYEPAQVPAEVIRALRGPDWHAPFAPVPPAPDLVRLTPAEVEHEAGTAATAFAGQATAVLAACAARPPATLKSGGVGARELARIGKSVQCEEPVVRLVLECAYEAGLLAYEDKALRASPAYDAWAEREPADQFATLLRAWWQLGRTPTAARDEEGKALPSATRTPPCSGCLAARHGLLAAAADLPESHGVRNPADLGPLVAWQRPFADELPQDTQPFGTLIREAELLGVLARGALSPLGTALLHDDDPATLQHHAGRLLPGAIGKARIGGDLTAVVTGAPSARLAALLDSLADREARGTASVWRFSPTSVRRALDAGRTPSEIESDLSAVAEGMLPQPLTYLIHDTARRHGRIRIAPAACVIHSDDTALLAEIAAHRKLTRLGLRKLAPTVLLCRTALPEALGALRAEGYAPVAETEDGAVRVERPEQPRTNHVLPRPRRALAAPAPAPLIPTSELATRLLAAPDRLPHPDPDRGIPFASDTEEILAGYAKALALTDIRQLAHAIHESEPITIEYVATSGNHTIRTVSELDFDPPYLHAYCHLREDERVFTLSRIQAVLPA